MLKHEDDCEGWQEYTATMLWSIGAIMGREHWRFPSYSELKHPNMADCRTAEQIKDDIVKRLTANDSV